MTTAQQLNRDITRRLQPLLRDMAYDIQQVELKRISQDPEKHRDTTLMGPRGLRYRYWEIKTGKTTRVRFGYCTLPNAAGYYLTWRETIDSKGTHRRENIRGHKLRREAKESAWKGYENFKSSLPSAGSGSKS